MLFLAQPTWRSVVYPFDVLFATMGVVELVVIHQILTTLDNERLTRRQADSLERLEIANRRLNCLLLNCKLSCRSVTLLKAYFSSSPKIVSILLFRS